jgi:hypothetical protein
MGGGATRCEIKDSKIQNPGFKIQKSGIRDRGDFLIL